MYSVLPYSCTSELMYIHIHTASAWHGVLVCLDCVEPYYNGTGLPFQDPGLAQLRECLAAVGQDSA
jgi:hypothetical protein